MVRWRKSGEPQSALWGSELPIAPHSSQLRMSYQGSLEEITRTYLNLLSLKEYLNKKISIYNHKKIVNIFIFVSCNGNCSSQSNLIQKFVRFINAYN